MKRMIRKPGVALYLSKMWYRISRHLFKPLEDLPRPDFNDHEGGFKI